MSISALVKKKWLEKSFDGDGKSVSCAALFTFRRFTTRPGGSDDITSLRSRDRRLRSDARNCTVLFLRENLRKRRAKNIESGFCVVENILPPAHARIYLIHRSCRGTSRVLQRWELVTRRVNWQRFITSERSSDRRTSRKCKRWDLKSLRHHKVPRQRALFAIYSKILIWKENLTGTLEAKFTKL